MGTIHALNTRRTAVDSPITVTAHGFACGALFVAWQTVFEIRAWMCGQSASNGAHLAFSGGDRCIVVCEERPGFEALDAAMQAAFPGTATWRDCVTLAPGERNETVLYRRVSPPSSFPPI